MSLPGEPDSGIRTGARVAWRASPAEHYSWASWPDGEVLYHRPSGKTHFLNASGAELLRQLLAAPGQSFEADDALLELLLRMEALGLVERVSDR